MGGLCYRAGVQPQTFAVAMNLNRAGFSESRATLLARFVEFWCQKNCFAEWHVEQTPSVLRVSFESTIDVVLFLISEEYGYFVPAATVRPSMGYAGATTAIPFVPCPPAFCISLYGSA